VPRRNQTNPGLQRLPNQLAPRGFIPVRTNEPTAARSERTRASPLPNEPDTRRARTNPSYRANQTNPSLTQRTRASPLPNEPDTRRDLVSRRTNEPEPHAVRTNEPELP